MQPKYKDNMHCSCQLPYQKSKCTKLSWWHWNLIEWQIWINISPHTRDSCSGRQFHVFPWGPPSAWCPPQPWPWPPPAVVGTVATPAASPYSHYSLVSWELWQTREGYPWYPAFLNKYEYIFLCCMNLV